MRALAEYVMRGRMQAAMVALLCTFLPLVSPAVVALVTLRRGLLDGSNIAIWAFLPVVVLTVINPEMLPISFISFSVLIALIGGAIVLKSVPHWSVSVIGLLFICATGAVVFGISFPEYIDQLVEALNKAQQDAIKASGIKDVNIAPFTHTLMIGVIAFAIAINAIAALLLGRWWQATLYNPGGFRHEIHQMRLSKTQSLFCFGLCAGSFINPAFGFWGLLAALPLFMVTAAIIHNRVFVKKQGVQWLILFYILVCGVQPIMWFTLLFGFTDAWVDYRKLFEPKNPPQNDN